MNYGHARAALVTLIICSSVWLTHAVRPSAEPGTPGATISSLTEAGSGSGSGSAEVVESKINDLQVKEPWTNCPEENENQLPAECWIEAAKRLCIGNGEHIQKHVLDAVKRIHDERSGEVSDAEEMYNIYKGLDPDKEPCKAVQKQTSEAVLTDEQREAVKQNQKTVDKSTVGGEASDAPENCAEYMAKKNVTVLDEELCWVQAAELLCKSNEQIHNHMIDMAEEDNSDISDEAKMHKVFQSLLKNPNDAPCTEAPAESHIHDVAAELKDNLTQVVTTKADDTGMQVTEPWKACPDSVESTDPENCWIEAAKEKCKGNPKIGDDMIRLGLEIDPSLIKSKVEGLYKLYQDLNPTAPPCKEASESEVHGRKQMNKDEEDMAVDKLVVEQKDGTHVEDNTDVVDECQRKVDTCVASCSEGDEVLERMMQKTFPEQVEKNNVTGLFRISGRDLSFEEAHKKVCSAYRCPVDCQLQAGCEEHDEVLNRCKAQDQKNNEFWFQAVWTAANFAGERKELSCPNACKVDTGKPIRIRINVDGAKDVNIKRTDDNTGANGPITLSVTASRDQKPEGKDV